MAGLIDALDIKRKSYFEFEGAPFVCLDVEVSKPTARGGQTLVRLKMRNLLTRAVFDKTFKASEKFKEPDLDMIDAAFLYEDADGCHFMDQATFETLTLSRETLGDDRLLLADNLPVQIQKFNGGPIGVQLPPHVELVVAHHRARGARRHGERRRDQACGARDRPRGPGAALHQGRREGARPHRDARVRRTRLTPRARARAR